MDEFREPFTYDELERAYRLVLSEEEAAELVHAPGDLEGSLRAGRIIGWGLTDDTLILLSLLSNELNARVEAYLEGLDAPLQPDWEARRNIIREALIAEGKLPANG